MRRGSLFAVIVVAFVLAIVPMALSAQSSGGLKITGIDFEVKIDDSEPCSLMMNAMIKTDGTGKLWYGFEGPTGARFDSGAEDTANIPFGHGVGVGRGAKFTTDIRGQFVLKAAVLGANGKKGVIVASKPVPGNYTCGNGVKVAKAVAAGTPVPKETKPKAEIMSAKLTAEVSKSSKCTINLRGEIATAGTKKYWYKFEAPAGSTFDYAAEYTDDIEPNSMVMLDKSISFTKEIHGVLQLKAATVDENGKQGSIVTSKPLPGDFTCVGGVAKPIAPGTATTRQTGTSKTPVLKEVAETAAADVPESAGFKVTGVKVANFTNNYNGPCPTNDMTFQWQVTATGKGTARIRFMQQTRLIREEAVTFTGPSTRTVTYRAQDMGNPGGRYNGWIGLDVIAPNKLSAEHAAYTMQCDPQAK